MTKAKINKKTIPEISIGNERTEIFSFMFPDSCLKINIPEMTARENNK
ncbi:MAG TPA: hypothetical protein GXZ93_02100 [Actinobacteria bacterium]|nr:hypothetical protein [Actinomycetota bacterium]